MRLDDIRPGADQRGVLLGQSGSGKTTLGIHLIQRLPFVLAIDPKHDLGRTPERTHLRGFSLVTEPGQLSETRAHRIQYRPEPRYQTPEWWESVYQWVYDRKHTFVYTDEVQLVLEGREPPDAFKACVQCGRGRGVGMLHATQRPAGVPQICISESQHVYAFILQNDYDRKSCVAAGVDEIIRTKPIRDPFWLYYKGPGVKGTRLLHLALGGKVSDRNVSSVR